MGQLVSASTAETGKGAAVILRKLLPLEQRPLILALEGKLGSGKTTFVKGAARYFGIRERVQSPTFVFVKWYDFSSRQGRGVPYKRLIHADAYRVETIARARRIFKGVFGDRDAIIVVEWADRIKKLIPRGAVWIKFRHRTPASRIIFYEAPRSH